MTTPAERRSPEERAQQIVEEVVARRRAGEDVPDEDVLREHPELLGVLERLLRQAAIVERVRATAAPAESRVEELFGALGGVIPTVGKAESPQESAPPDGEDDAAPGDDASPDAPQTPASNDSSSRHPTMPIQPSLRKVSIRGGVASGPRDGEFQTLAGDSVVPAPAARGADDDIEWVSVDKDLSEGEGDVGNAKADEPGGEKNPVFDSAAELPPVAPAADEPAGTARFRPDGRPPMAVLRVLDDNQLGGQSLRIRDSRFTIGREGCDLSIPHDSLMSTEHAVIERSSDDKSGWRWVLRDVGSTNGVFVRVRRVRLRDGDRLMMGGRMVLFRQPSEAGKLPCLEDISGDRPGGRLVLDADEHWIGRDSSQCGPFLSNEPTLDPQFARLSCRKDGRWTIHTHKSVNGLWVRVTDIPLASGGMFQLGEQRFAFFV